MPKLTRRDFIRSNRRRGRRGRDSALGFDVAHAVEVKQSLRIAGAKEVHSLCPYCAVGCALVAYTKQDAQGHTQLLQIEGDPDSPVNEGRLCPKGATAMQLAVSSRRVREAPLPGAGQRPLGGDQLGRRCWTGWPSASRTSRDATFVTVDAERATPSTDARASPSPVAPRSASEEGYFAAKLMRTLGVVHLEQQARV